MRVRALLLMLPFVACGGPSPLPETGVAEDGLSRALSGHADGLYNGVARWTGLATCTAVLLRTAQEDPPGAPAFVATSGHCAGARGSNEVIIDTPGLGEVTFNYFEDTVADQLRVPIASIRYATMKGHDLAIAELEATLGELTGAGLRAWPIADFTPGLGEPVAVVGAPVHDGGTGFLRLAACRLEARPGLVLERQWHWYQPYRSGCADIRAGSSGSPAILRNGGRLIGLVNTTTIGSEGSPDCSAGRPCEASGHEGLSLEDATYVIPLLGVDRCFDPHGRFDRGLDGCPLDAAANVEVDPTWLGPVNPTLPDGVAGPERVAWQVRVLGPPEFGYYRYKLGPAGDIACRSEPGYGAPLAIEADSRIDEALPRVDGFYSLCVLGGTTALPSSGTWQRTNDATVVGVQIDTAPPGLLPQVRVEATGGWTSRASARAGGS